MSEEDPTTARRAAEAAREYDPYRSEFLEHEFETYDLLREHVPIARAESMTNPSIGGDPSAWVVTRYEHGAEVLKDPEHYSSQGEGYPVRPWIPQAVDPPMHTSYRRILNPWFTAEAMSKLEPRLEAFAAELADRMLDKDRFDFVAEYADPFPTVIFCELAGFPAEDYEQIMDWKNTIMHGRDFLGHPRGFALACERARALGHDVDPTQPLPREIAIAVAASAAQETYGYFQTLLDERRARPKDDLVSLLLEAQYDGERPLTQEELEDTLFLLFMAGLDTVASVLGLIVQDFATNAGTRREFIALMDDPEAIGRAIEELVRVHSIVLLPRRVTREHSFHGTLFREGDQVLVPTMASNRDRGEFADPHAVDYGRLPNRHLGFGLGPHRCLGIHLARREVRVALQTFLRRCPDFELDPESPAVAFGGMKGLSSLPLVRR